MATPGVVRPFAEGAGGFAEEKGPVSPAPEEEVPANSAEVIRLHHGTDLGSANDIAANGPVVFHLGRMR
jgi:hypothetical protein